MKWKTCKGLQYVYFSNSLHQEQNCAVLCIIGMHSSMHNQVGFFFYRSTVTRLVHSISHKHRNPALTYSKMFVVAKRSRLMSPSRVSCMSTCSLRYLNSNVATRAICSKKTSVHSLMNRTFSSSGQVNCGEATATIKKRRLQTWHASQTRSLIINCTCKPARWANTGGKRNGEQKDLYWETIGYGKNH